MPRFVEHVRSAHAIVDRYGSANVAGTIRGDGLYLFDTARGWLPCVDIRTSEQRPSRESADHAGLPALALRSPLHAGPVVLPDPLMEWADRVRTPVVRHARTRYAPGVYASEAFAALAVWSVEFTCEHVEQLTGRNTMVHFRPMSDAVPSSTSRGNASR